MLKPFAVNAVRRILRGFVFRIPVILETHIVPGYHSLVPRPFPFQLHECRIPGDRGLLDKGIMSILVHEEHT